MFLPALSQEVPGLKRWPWGLICRSVIDNSSGELTKIMNFGNLSSRLFIKLRVINYMYLISVYCQVSFFFFFLRMGHLAILSAIHFISVVTRSVLLTGLP